MNIDIAWSFLPNYQELCRCSVVVCTTPCQGVRAVSNTVIGAWLGKTKKVIKLLLTSIQLPRRVRELTAWGAKIANILVSSLFVRQTSSTSVKPAKVKATSSHEYVGRHRDPRNIRRKYFAETD